jgi:hypothetical protein
MNNAFSLWFEINHKLWFNTHFAMIWARSFINVTNVILLFELNYKLWFNTHFAMIWARSFINVTNGI